MADPQAPPTGLTATAPLQAAAAAAAPPIVPAPPVPPAPPVFALGPGRSQDILDYMSPTGSKIYFKATAPLDDKFDGKADTCNLFLAKIKNRARTFGWSSTLSVPNDTGISLNLLKTFRMVTLANVRARSLANHSGQQTQDAQNAEMLYRFLYDSLGLDFQAKVHLHDQDYTINAALDGPCLLKKIIMLTFIDTCSTTTYIRELLVDMAIKLPKFNHNITTFNLWVETQVATLRSQGEDASNLLTYIWKAYLTVPDCEFIRYIKGHCNCFLDGTANHTAEEIMLLADNYYKTRFQQDNWMKPSGEEEEIVALNAKIASLKKRATPVKDGTPRQAPNCNNTTASVPKAKAVTKQTVNVTPANDAVWIKVKPKASDTKQNGIYTKSVKDKVYYWCIHHNDGQGQWVRHSPAECRNKPDTTPEINITAFDTKDSNKDSTDS